jgi:hypothetical protein
MEKEKVICKGNCAGCSFFQPGEEDGMYYCSGDVGDLLISGKKKLEGKEAEEFLKKLAKSSI